jgi:probable addiction module antidote protein
MPKRTASFDSWQMEKLSDPELAQRYLTAVLDEAPERFLAALGNVARAYQMSVVAKKSGVAREHLYQSLSEKGNATWSTLLPVLKALNLKFPGVVAAGSDFPIPPRGGSPKSYVQARLRKIQSRAGRDRGKAMELLGQLPLEFPAEIAQAAEVTAVSRPLQRDSGPGISSTLTVFEHYVPIRPLTTVQGGALLQQQQYLPPRVEEAEENLIGVFNPQIAMAAGNVGSYANL